MILSHALRAVQKSSALSLSFVSSANNTQSETITVPSTALAGDIIILYDSAGNTSGLPTTVTPSGFTSINVQSGTTVKVNLSYIVTTTNLANTTLTGMNGTNVDRKCLIVIRPSSTGVTASVAQVAGQLTDSAPTNQIITIGAGQPPLIVLGAYRNTTATNQTMTPTENGTVTATGTGTSLKYKIYNSSPLTTTVTCGDSGTQNALQSCYISFS